MKKYLVIFLTLLLAIGTVQLGTQAQQVPTGYSALSRVAGKFYAANYNTWRSQIVSGNSATGSQSITIGQLNAGPIPGVVTLSDGRVIQPFRVNQRILVGIGSNQETVTLTAASNCPPAGPVNPVAVCTLTGVFANTHGAAEPIYSGSFGLDEAVGDSFNFGGGAVVVDGSWFGTLAILQATNLTNLNGLSNTYIEAVQGAPGGASYWSPTPGTTLISTPTALTATTLTTATTGGTIATGAAVRVCIIAEDQFGGETACSNDSGAGSVVTTGAGATNSITVTAAGVPTGTGIVAYRMYATAAAGATQTETLALATNLTCTAAPQAPLVGSCLPGNAIILTSLPATTNAGVPIGTAGAATAFADAHTTVTVRQGAIVPAELPFFSTGIAGHYPVTATSTASAQTMGEIPYQAGYFNTLGATYRICGGGVTTPSAATVAGTWSIRIGQRLNSAGTSSGATVVPLGFVASNQWTAAASAFDFCTDVTTTATGATGTMEGHATNFCVVVAAGNDGAGTDTCVGAFNAASSTFDLTQQGVIQLNYLQSAASWTVPQLRYFNIKRIG